MTIKKSLKNRLPKKQLSPQAALEQLLAPGGGVFASADINYKDAVFGRDSLEIAQDLLLKKPKVSRSIILNVARLQGTKYHNLSEEEPGRIHHEHRQAVVGGRQISADSRVILEQLAAKWGGTKHEVTYYGSVDATPLFIRLVGDYINRYGKQILNEKLLDREDRVVSLKECLGAALEWLTLRLDKSPIGMLESHSSNPRGIQNQVWKDSHEFYTHPNGKTVNHNRGVASIEVQGLVYDALLIGAELFPKRSIRLHKLAHHLQQKVFAKLWLDGRDYFALGLDYGKANRPRIIKTITANPGALLDSRIFDNLNLRQKQKYIGGIINVLFSANFLTNAGIRSRSLEHKKLIKYWDYHGSYAVWPKETQDIIRGLRRHGFMRLAKELENRMLGVITASGSYPEFVYVDDKGRVLSGKPAKFAIGKPLVAESTNTPENIQGWTVSAVIESAPAYSFNRIPKWQKQLEKVILARIPRMPRLKTKKQALNFYPQIPYRLKLPPNHKPFVSLRKLSKKRLAKLPAISLK